MALPRAFPLLFAAWAVVAPAQSTPLWLRYPAISPDGKAIVFSYQGDLYRVSSSGGTALPLTLGDSHNFSPVWSHDGQWLAFASDRHGNFDVFVMPSQGGPARRLTSHSAADLPSSFSADDREVLFTSFRLPSAASRQFPSRTFTQTYTVPRAGGQAHMLHTVPMEAASVTAAGTHILYQDIKGYEDPWRKHHTSAVTRDLWSYGLKDGSFTRLTSFAGEDRNPVASVDGDSFFYLSERPGSFNVFQSSLANPAQSKALTSFTRHPVRFLTASRDNTLCYTFDGEIYTQKPQGQPTKLAVNLMVDGKAGLERILPVSGGMTEMSVSPNGKEVAFVARGEVFVTSADGKLTRRITNTPGQERSVSFSPDGRTLIYAAERNGSWDIFSQSLVNPGDTYFHTGAKLAEKAVVATAADEFQPLFSPDGKEVAYLEERTSIKVKQLATGTTRTLLPEGVNYSYADGDQEFRWSPDGKWLTLAYNSGMGWITEVGLLAADGKSPIRNLSQSGFYDGRPQFSQDGSVVFWVSDREGFRDVSQGGTTGDVFGLFLTRAAWDRFRLSKEEFALVKEREDKEEKDRAALKEKEAKEKNDKKDKKAKPEPEKAPLAIDWEGYQDRRVRLSSHTADLLDATLAKAGDKLYYLAKFEKGFDLWSQDLRTKETKLTLKLDAKNASLERTEDGKSLFLLADGKLLKVELESGKREDLPVNAELVQQPLAEREYIFDHAWRQVTKKFYVTDLHGVDWPFYRDAYRKFLPHIRNNYDFQEVLSEMLGELNGSHTGARYNPPQVNTDATASLGLLLEPTSTGKGLRIAEAIKKGPVDLAASKVRAGHLLLAIEGTEISAAGDPARLLNRRAAKPTLLTFQDPASGQTWDESIKPITAMQENELMYQRWVERNRQETLRLSKGRLGYVHVRGMNDSSMRTVIDEVLGQHLDRDALVVDTRFNGGGNLHEQLSDFLSGKKYYDVIPRGQSYGHQPMQKWIKPSIVLMSEGNYSDAHLFPVAYKIKGLGQTVGMPVPGTGTFVWWESQIDPSLVFGIPQGGWRTPDGKFCENNQLEPDIAVPTNPALISANRDEQLEVAVKTLLESLPKQK